MLLPKNKESLRQRLRFANDRCDDAVLCLFKCQKNIDSDLYAALIDLIAAVKELAQAIDEGTL